MSGARGFVQLLLGVLTAAAVGATVWILSLPSKAECRASGRIVDPTERHCTFDGGYQQLEEHAAFHATQAAVPVLIVLSVAYAVWRLARRRR